MAIRTKHEISDNTWFITFTCYDWLPLFELTQSYDLVYKWLKLADEKYQIKTIGFVIMPNHVHLLLYLTDENVNLNTIISNAKRFMTYDIIERLSSQGNHDILAKLAAACSAKEKAKGQLHKGFQPSFDAKPYHRLPGLLVLIWLFPQGPLSRDPAGTEGLPGMTLRDRNGKRLLT